MKIIFKFILVLLLIEISFGLKTDAEFEKKYQLKIVKIGDYEHYPEKGEEVRVHYTGKLLDGTKFDSSKDRNEPFKFKIGNGQVIKCWEEVISKMTLGDHVIVICPANLAYGARGFDDLIPPNSDLEFEIQMLSFGKHKRQKAKPKPKKEDI